MENIVSFLLDNIANITSPYGITRNLVSDGVAIDHKTVGNYLKYYVKGLFFIKLNVLTLREVVI